MSTGGLCGRVLWALMASGTIAGTAPAARNQPGSSPAGEQEPAAEVATHLALPVAFVENRGQWPAPVRFATAAGRLRAVAQGDGVVLTLPAEGPGGAVSRVAIRLSFEGDSDSLAVEGEGELSTRWGFFRGKDPAHWRTGARAYSSVVYRCLRDGIDLRLRAGPGDSGPLEYDILLEPGADTEKVVIRCEGAETALDDDGYLLLLSPYGAVAQAPPLAWEELPRGGRRPLASGFRLLGPHAFGFTVEGRDRDLPAVIDPRLTLLGGEGDDGGYAIKVGPDGSVFVVGENGSFDIPMLTDQPGVVYAGQQDALVAQYDPMLRELLWVVDLGSPGTDRAADLAIGADGSLTVVGYASADGFPVTPGALRVSHGGGLDAFVVRLRPDPALDPEDQLLYSSLIGGSGDETATGVALEADGTACVVGCTSSWDFPMVEGALDRDYNGGTSDAFLCLIRPEPELSPEQQLAYSTYLGGSAGDCHPASQNIHLYMYSLDLELEPSGAALLAGATYSSDFPTTPAALERTYRGSGDVFVARVVPDPDLPPEEQLSACTLIGSTSTDEAAWVGLEGSGTVVVGGRTWSADFPVTRGPLGSSLGGEGDAFAIRLSPDFDELTYGVRIGGPGLDITFDGGLDGQGRIALCGGTWAPGFPTTPGAYQPDFRGAGDGFVAIIDPSLAAESQLVASTLLGGGVNDSYDGAWGLDFAAPGIVALTGFSMSSDFGDRGEADVHDRTFRGVSDFFVARFDLRGPTAAFALEPAQGWVPLTVHVDASASSTPVDTGPLVLAWDFGAGPTVGEVTASHTYDAIGRHVVGLTVTNVPGLSARATHRVTVSCPSGDITPWIAGDVGDPLFPGSSRQELATFHLCAGGTGIATSGDECHLMYQEREGDFELTVRLSDLAGGNALAGAGLMLRDSLDPKAVFVAVVAEKRTAEDSPSALNLRLRQRATAGGSATLASLGTIEDFREAPLWLRIRREGELVEVQTSRSPDGSFSGTPQHESSLAGPVLVGLVAWGKDTRTQTTPFAGFTARFDELEITDSDVSSPGFVRGDANADSAVDISDGVWILGYLFLGGTTPTCLDAADVDDSADDAPTGGVDISDAIYLLNHLFLGGPEPPPPYPECGPDPTADALGCESFPPCE